MPYIPDVIPPSHQVNLFDMDMKHGDVLPLAEVVAHLRARGRR